MPRKARRFASKAQWRAMHAKHGHRGWVKKWTHRNERAAPYKTLPRRKSARKRTRF